MRRNVSHVEINPLIALPDHISTVISDIGSLPISIRLILSCMIQARSGYHREDQRGRI